MKSLLFALLLLVASCPALHAYPGDPRPIHDPSTIIWCNNEYWLFATGRGIDSWHSGNLLSWRPGPPVFTDFPSWITQIDPTQHGNFWAPDIVFTNGQYRLYYAVSKWASNSSAIALATNPTLDPFDPGSHWTDSGIVIRTTGGDDFNAIDPSILIDTDSRIWMAFGSFWSGIKLVELNPATGLRKSGAPVYPLAHAKEIEAPCIISHQGSYFLFVNWGLCCRGIYSTYNIRVGRATRVTGPYLDKNGIDMRSGGGTLFLGNEGPRIGPGQAGIFRDGANEWLSYHYYDANRNGAPTLGIRRLAWDPTGWPLPGPIAPVSFR